jgi:hypothetical protein
MVKPKECPVTNASISLRWGRAKPMLVPTLHVLCWAWSGKAPEIQNKNPTLSKMILRVAIVDRI